VCIIPQAVTHSLVLLKMGKIIARNMLSSTNKPSLLHLVVSIIYISLYFFKTCEIISIYFSTECRVFHNVTFFGS
jgi:hypothetical protein